MDGSPFAAGKTVRVEATVWAYAGFASDKLDVYYTASAGAPAWTTTPCSRCRGDGPAPMDVR